MNLEQICADELIKGGLGLKDTELHKYLSGLSIIPMSVFKSINLLETLLKKFSDQVLKYINNDVKLMPQHYELLAKYYYEGSRHKYPSFEYTDEKILEYFDISKISTENLKKFIYCFRDYSAFYRQPRGIDIKLANIILKLPQHEVIELLIKNSYAILELAQIIPQEYFNNNIVALLLKKNDEYNEYSDIELVKIIPQEYFDDKIIKSLIKKCESWNIPELAKIIPQEYFDDEIIKSLIKNCFAWNILELVKIIPYFDNETIQLLISQCNEYVVHIPQQYFDDNIIKLLFFKTCEKDILKVFEAIPLKWLNRELIVFLIKKCHRSDSLKLAQKIPEEYYDDEIIKLLIKNVSCASHEIYELIPLKYINKEIIKLLINNCFSGGVICMAKIIPQEYFDDEIIKLLIKRYCSNNITKLIEIIPQEYFNIEIIKLLINVCFQDDIHAVAKIIPHEYLNDEIKKLIIEKKEIIDKSIRNFSYSYRTYYYGGIPIEISIEIPIFKNNEKFLKNNAKNFWNKEKSLPNRKINKFKKIEINHEKCSFRHHAGRLPNIKIDKRDEKRPKKKLNKWFS